MKENYIQLKLNFEAAPLRPLSHERTPSIIEADSVAHNNFNTVITASVVQLKNVRDMRERIKRMEEERVLMERIRARIAHLQG